MSRQYHNSARSSQRARRFRTVFFGGIAVFVLLYAAGILRGGGQAAAQPSFSGLIDADGRPLRPETFDHRFRLVFFGFTQCSAVCPMTLVKVRSVMSTVGPGAPALSPVFISLDPEHDQPTVLKNYTVAIDPRIVGVTGDSQLIEQLAKAFGVVVVRHPESPGSRAVDHSARLYLIGPDNRVLQSYDADEPASVIASDIARRMRG